MCPLCTSWAFEVVYLKQAAIFWGAGCKVQLGSEMTLLLLGRPCDLLSTMPTFPGA